MENREKFFQAWKKSWNFVLGHGKVMENCQLENKYFFTFKAQASKQNCTTNNFARAFGARITAFKLCNITVKKIADYGTVFIQHINLSQDSKDYSSVLEKSWKGHGNFV